MSFEVALTGLNAASSNLEVISNNIANGNTHGFKRSRAEFADVYAASDFGVAANQTGKGVRVLNIRQQFTQGDVKYTENSLDLAISGSGFFRVADANDGIVYTRAGMFGLDREGYIVNAAEQRLTGYVADKNGTILPTLGTLKVDTSDLAPKASKNIDLGLNLDNTSPVINSGIPFSPDDPASFNFTTAATVYDSQGASHVVNLYFRNEGANDWKAYAYMNGQPILSEAGDGATPKAALLHFDEHGKLVSVDGSPSLTIRTDSFSPGPGVSPLQLTLNVADTTHFNSPSGLNKVVVDGYTSGRLASLDIDSTGVIFGRYTNGQSMAMGQIALANFASVEGLRQIGNTTWAETWASGQPAVGAPGTASLGNIQSSALESSNVDITKELVDMIGAQRSFQANAQVVSVADNITQTIINMRR